MNGMIFVAGLSAEMPSVSEHFNFEYARRISNGPDL